MLPKDMNSPASPKPRPVPKPRKVKPRKLDPSVNAIPWYEAMDVPKSASYVQDYGGVGSGDEPIKRTVRSGSAPEAGVAGMSHVTDIRSLWENGQTENVSRESPRHLNGASNGVSKNGAGHVTNYYVPGNKIDTGGAIDKSSMLQNIVNLRIRANSINETDESSEVGLNGRTFSVGSNCSSGSPSPSHAAPMVSGHNDYFSSLPHSPHPLSLSLLRLTGEIRRRDVTFLEAGTKF